MISIVRFFSILILCFQFFATTVYSADGTVVSRVYDGDTVALRDGRVIRIAYIDTPEMNYKTGDHQYYAIQAKRKLADMVLGKRITIAKQVAKDRYGRYVAIIKNEKGIDIGISMIRQGAAVVYPVGNKDSAYISRLVTFQREAISKKYGLWARMVPFFQKQPFVVGNKRSKRFFSKNCKQLKSVARYNRIRFESAVKAFLSGYVPVRKCKIWPDKDYFDEISVR